ncbi:MAG: hypothetical protein KME01_09490 [Chroococcus sp. CMT-3BRIN-NPC107]|jgi:hypothetical protein|nr:hypothetical protein [Chroococcus sp. CMT-3BRIN-NPC107]
MNIFICPGFHLPELTRCFLQELSLSADLTSTISENILTFSVKNYTPLSSLHILQNLLTTYGQPAKAAPIVFISFSAGVIGALGAAWGWELLGGKVKALIAIDGWGVPLGGNFPIHRLSHDYFTHTTSIVLSRPEDSFYADPMVEHLDMWRSPSTVTGWMVSPSNPNVRSYLNEAEFILRLLKRYQEID